MSPTHQPGLDELCLVALKNRVKPDFQTCVLRFLAISTMKFTDEPAEILAEGKFLRLISQGTWEYADRIRASGAVLIVAVTPERKLILVEQFRIPLGCHAIELPAGLVGDIPGEEHEALQIAAERELLEETGFSAAEWHWLMTGPSSPGMCTEMATLFLAKQLTREHAGGGDHTEDIVVHEIALAEVPQWLQAQHAAGKAIDPKVYAGLFFATQGT
jgi:ADP-ribose pyrophosphatase